MRETMDDRPEREQRRALAFQTLGRLTPSLVHNLNNLLTAMHGRIGVARTVLGPDHPASAELDALADAAEQAAKVTRGALAAVRLDDDSTRTVELGPLVADVVASMRPMIHRSIELLARREDSVSARVVVDASTLQNVLVNLLLDACDTLSDGGRIAVSIEVSPPPPGGDAVGDAEVRVRCSPLHTGRVPIRQRTTAADGMPVDGMGAALARAVLLMQAGTLTREESADGSVTNVIRLRLAPPAPRQVDAQHHAGELIVVAEGHEQVRQLLAGHLAAIGFRVCAAATGAELMRAAGDTSDPPQLVIVAADLPNGGNVECLRRLRDSVGSLPVLVTTGAGTVLPAELQMEFTTVLRKPFRLAEIAATVQALLRRGASARLG